MERIKECPFCGGCELRVSKFSNFGFSRLSVICNSCHAQGPSVIATKNELYTAEEEAKRRWNIVSSIVKEYVC